MREIRSAEHAVALYFDLYECVTSVRAVNLGERVQRPKVLSCPHCGCGSWKHSKAGKIICAGRKCDKPWPCEWVSSTGLHPANGKPPAEHARLTLATLGLILTTARRSEQEPPPLTLWQRVVLFKHTELGRTRAGVRMRTLVEELQHAFPRARPWAPWQSCDVRRLLGDAERAVEERLRWKGMLED